MQFEKLLQQSLIWRGFYFTAVLLLNIVLSRYLQAAGAGWVYFLTNLFSLYVLVGSINLDSGFTFYGANKTIPYPALAWFGLLVTLLASLLLIPVFKYYFFHNPIATVPISRTVSYGAYYTVGIILGNLFTVLFYAQKNFSTPNICLGIINYLLVGLIIYLSKTHAETATIVNIYFIFFTVQGVVLAVVFFWQNNFYSFQLPSLPQFRLLLKYSLIAMAGNFIFFLVYRIDFWFVEHYRTQAELGNYIQASKIGQMLLIVPQILASVVFPQTAEGLNEKTIKQNILIISRLMIQLFLVLIVLAFFFGKLVFVTVFGSTFYSMHLPFLLLLPGILALAILTLFSAYFGGSNRIKVNVFGAAVALVSMVVGNYFFTFRYGIVAAAIISSISYSINLFFSLYIFFKTEKSFSMIDFFRWGIEDYRWVRQLLMKGK
jgi:O-antigen/teichoic acid export membrane protein